jgi:hypothetical protein
MAVDSLIGEKVQFFDDLRSINGSTFAGAEVQKKAA